MEKAYRAMRNSGAGSIAVGIIVLVVGVTAGGVSIINSGRVVVWTSVLVAVQRRGVEW